MISLRFATLGDLDAVLPRSRAMQEHEGITLDAGFEPALRRLLADPSLGGCWLVERAGAVVGYAIVTYGFDLEFGGRDSYLTEFWIDLEERGRGAGTEALAALADDLRAREICALHLQVRPDNPALRLYERSGFEASPRLVMTRRLG
jgi:ribosomal protein S18 acetylase RimI-like enzyme